MEHGPAADNPRPAPSARRGAQTSKPAGPNAARTLGRGHGHQPNRLAGLTWRCRPRKTTAKAPCPTRSLLLYSKSPTTSMAASREQAAGGRAAVAVAAAAGISTAGPQARNAPEGRRTGAAGAPSWGGRSCREAAAGVGEATKRGRGQRGLARPQALFMARPAAGHGLPGEAASGKPGQGRRGRQCSRPESHARSGEVRSPMLPMPRCSGRFRASLPGRSCCGRRPRIVTARAEPARFPPGCAQRTGARPAAPARTARLRDVSKICRTQRTAARCLRREKECAHSRRPPVTIAAESPGPQQGREAGCESA